MQGKNLQACWRTSKIFNAADGKICRKDVRLGLWEQPLSNIKVICERAEDGQARLPFPGFIAPVGAVGDFTADGYNLLAYAAPFPADFQIGLFSPPFQRVQAKAPGPLTGPG